MRRLSEIERSTWEEDDDERKELSRLEREGHIPIAVGRATAVIEQCDEDDDIPASRLGAKDALRIAFHADPGSGPMSSPPDCIYLYGDKRGLWDAILCKRDSGALFRLEPVELGLSDALEDDGTDSRAARVLADYVRANLQYHPHDDCPARIEAEIDGLRQIVLDALDRYADLIGRAEAAAKG